MARFSVRNDRVFARHGEITDDLVGFVMERVRHFFGEVADIASDGDDRSFEGVEVVLSTLNPLFDTKLVGRMIDLAERHGRPVTCEGAVGGTEPVSVRHSSGPDEPYRLIWSSQFAHNAQLNLRKLKRVKVFLALRNRFPALQRMPTSEVLDFLGCEEGTELVLRYGEDVELERLPACPNCANADTDPIAPGECQPRIGYLTRNSSYYRHCGLCGLVYLQAILPEDELFRLYDWYDKERTEPLGEADYTPEALKTASYYQNFKLGLDRFASLVPEGGHILDLGGGAGFFSVMAKRQFPSRDVSMIDFDCSEVEGFLASQSVNARSMDFLHEQLPQAAFDMITMWEVVEHLRVERLKELWPRIHDALRPGGLFVFSTPDFESPITRALDFWAAFVPQHLTVLSRRVLEPMWESAGFELVEQAAESFLLREDQGDFAYAASNGASLAARAQAAILDGMLSDQGTRAAIGDWLNANGRGGEMIICLRKRG